MISTRDLLKLPLDVQVRRFFQFLYSTRSHPKGGVPLPVAMPVAVHRYHCPVTRMGKCYGPCDCGGDRINRELDRMLHALKKTARFKMKDVRRFDL